MKIYRPLKAIRLKCLDCCADQQAEVRKCPIKDCTLWPYRMGHRPIDGEVSPDDAESENNARLTGIFDTEAESDADVLTDQIENGGEQCKSQI